MKSLAAVLLLLTAPSVTVEKQPMSVHDFTVNTLDGTPKKLSDYKGKVLLIVNTASECGFTPQYEGLQKLWETRKDSGVMVLGFPSNDFGAQEPGTPAQIKTFCETKFHVSFPLFEKVKTKGKDAAPLYAFLGSKNGEPKWNFHKYVVGKNGEVRAAFPSAVKPDSAELAAALDAALNEK